MNEISITSDFSAYIDAFIQENRKLNLISKNDVPLLYEKHIYDSLAIKLFFSKYGQDWNNVLDIGCGGGFPCVPVAIEFPLLKITGIDSIRKKINAVENIKQKLNITNLSLICDRVENIKNEKYNLIISRAVADLVKICEYALPLLAADGYFVAYKSQKSAQEIQNAQFLLEKYGAKVADVINYTLPTVEKHERNLVVVSF